MAVINEKPNGKTLFTLVCESCSCRDVKTAREVVKSVSYIPTQKRLFELYQDTRTLYIECKNCRKIEEIDW